jgi:hypothetical protein
MILDGLLRFTNYPSPAGDTMTAGTSSFIIDLGIGQLTPTNWVGIPDSSRGGGARDIGIGDRPALKLLVQVLTAANGTLSVALQGAVDNGSGAPAAFSTWWISPTYAQATLVAGARLMDMDMPRPPAGVAEPRYLQLLYAGTATAGTLAGFIVLDRWDQFYNATNNAIPGGYVPGIAVAN